MKCLPQFYLVGAIAILVSLSLSSTTTSAHFFPNASSIPSQLLNKTITTVWQNFMSFSGSHVGTQYKGLSKLKQYFNQFGYITSSHSNFTDDFDDIFESAIKTYQKNFNLNVTGKLDQQTLEQIVQPRCGVADIIHGYTTMNSGKINATSLTNITKFHSVNHYTFFPEKPRWPANKQNLTYAFFPGNALPDAVKAIFATAFDRWSEVTPLTFTETSSLDLADIKIGFFAGDHGDGEPFDGTLGTLAHASSPPTGMLHLDGDEDWVVADDVTPSPLSTAVDLESVVVHEIGHLLGLGHSSVKDAIMYPTLASSSRKVELGEDDIQGIQELYGTDPNLNGSTVTVTQERDVNGGESGHHVMRSTWGLMTIMVAIGLGLLAF